MSLTRSGTGLRADNSPPGLKLSTSLFTAAPDEEMAVVDAYDITSSGVINSITDEEGVELSFIDKAKAAISNGLNSLPNPADLLAAVKAPMSALQSGANALRQITNVTSRAMSAVNQIKNGGVMGALGGVTSLAGMSGIQGVSQLASQARGVAVGISRGGISGVLQASGSVLGNSGASLNQLANNVNSIARAGASLKSAVNGGDLNSILNGVNYSLSSVSGAVASLDKASQINFQTGFDSVINSVGASVQSYNQSAVGKIQSAVGSFTDSFLDDVSYSVPVRAGTTAGFVVTASELGDDNIYSLVNSKGMDYESSFTAGVAMGTYGSTTGNLSLIADIASVETGAKALASNTNAVASTVSNLKPTKAQRKQPLYKVYDDIVAVSNVTGQNWNTSEREGKTVLDTTNVSGSGYSTQVVQAKASDDHATARKAEPIIDPAKAKISEAQTMAAAAAADADYQKRLAEWEAQARQHEQNRKQTSSLGYSGGMDMSRFYN